MPYPHAPPPHHFAQPDPSHLYHPAPYPPAPYPPAAYAPQYPAQPPFLPHPPHAPPHLASQHPIAGYPLGTGPPQNWPGPPPDYNAPSPHAPPPPGWQRTAPPADAPGQHGGVQHAPQHGGGQHAPGQHGGGQHGGQPGQHAAPGKMFTPKAAPPHQGVQGGGRFTPNGTEVGLFWGPKTPTSGDRAAGAAGGVVQV